MKKIFLILPMLVVLTATLLAAQPAEPEEKAFLELLAALQAPPAPPAHPVPPGAPAPPAPPRYLGVGIREIDSERAKALKLSEEYGVEITAVTEGSPAEKAGIKVGDVVLEYSGHRVEGTEQLMRLVRETPPGRQVKLLISRNGATQTITATIGERKCRLLHGSQMAEGHGQASGRAAESEIPDRDARYPQGHDVLAQRNAGRGG